MNHIDPTHIKGCPECRALVAQLATALNCPHYIRPELQDRCGTCHPIQK
jgi:hypothetical protein